MRRAHLLGAVAAVCFATGAHATIAEVEIGGRFFWPTYASLPDTGYVYGVKDYPPGPLDNTGVTFGTVVNFNRNPLTGVGPLDLSFISPNFGNVAGVFNTIISDVVTAAGIFYTLGGELNGGAATISVNDVFPGHGVASFGLLGAFAYTAPTPPPIDPPICVINCGGDPPITPVDPPSVVTAPEPSTWAMMAIGFASLGLVGYRRQRGARLAAFA